ncbi:MAG: phosphatase PAP2 family protein [candidate division WOR-3 bacterium]
MILALTSAIFLLEDASHALSAPRRWDRKAWLVVAASVSAGAGFFILDGGIRDLITGGQNEDLLAIADGLDHFGNGLWLSSGLLLASGAGFVAKDQTLVDAGLVGIESWLLAGAISQIGKYGFGRARPYLNEGPFSFSPLSAEEDRHSFPSGHSAVAFAGLSGFGFRTRNPWIIGTCLAIASGVAWARVYQDAHWASDVFWGAALGTAIGYSLANKHDQRQTGLSFEGGRVIYRF